MTVGQLFYTIQKAREYVDRLDWHDNLSEIEKEELAETVDKLLDIVSIMELYPS